MVIMLVVTGSDGVAALSGTISCFMKSTVWCVTKRSQSRFRPSTGLSNGSIWSHDWTVWLQNVVHHARLSASSDA